MSFPRLLKYSDLILLTIQYRWSPTIDILKEDTYNGKKELSIDNCLLCQYFVDFMDPEVDCEGCPISIRTHESRCNNTSFYKFHQAYSTHVKLFHAREMLRLLWDLYSHYLLRPEFNKEIESTEEFIRVVQQERDCNGLPPIKLFE